MKKLNLLIILVVAIFASCTDPNVTPSPVASFNYSGDNNFAPCSIKFTNQSENSVSYNWDFGDGETSTETNPSHVYSAGGTYTVLLTVKNDAGVENESSKVVSVLDKPTKLQMNKLTVTSFPSTEENGAGWDINNGPDIMFKITDENSTNYFESSYYEDVTVASVPLVFTNGLPLTFTVLDFDYIIQILDYDGLSANDWMGAYYFNPANSMPTDGSTYPTTLNFSSSETEVSFTIDVEWVE